MVERALSSAFSVGYSNTEASTPSDSHLLTWHREQAICAE